MDPLTGLIVTALALGAAKGVHAIAEHGIKDAYAGLKQFIIDKYQDHRSLKMAVDGLEAEPDSEDWQEMTAKKLAEAGADEDTEVIRLAQQLHQILADKAPEVYEAYGVKLTDVQAVNAKIEGIRSTGSGVTIDRGKFTGNLTIRRVDAGPQSRGADPNP